MPFDGIVTHAVTDELQRKILPGKVTKIFQPTDTELVFTIRSGGKNHSLLFSIHPTYARFHITNDSYKNPQEPPMFCMLLRKHLSGAILEEISQYELERIITFRMKARNEIGDITYKTCRFELMGRHSNFIFIDEENGHIIDSLKHVSMTQNRHRTILPGSQYKFPPLQDKFNPLTVDAETIIKRLDFNAGKMDMQILQLLTGFSPFLAKEFIHRVHLGTQSKYKEQWTELQSQLQYKIFNPVIYKGKREEFHVLPITSWEGESIAFDSTNQMLDEFYSGKAERDRVKQRAKDLYRFITNEKNKHERKRIKHEKTLNKAANAGDYQKKGELLTAHMHQVQKGDNVISVVDYYDPEQKEITIELNPNKTPSENAQNFFKKYQKLKTSKKVVNREIIRSEREVTYFDQLLQQMDVASETDIEEIRQELREEGYLKKQKQGKKGKNKPKKPVPEQYISTDGTPIFVGKNNKQNEYVTMKLANRDDIWLHTKDIPGSHVIIQSSEPTEKTLLEAALIAAYFSKAQLSASVPVDYTKVRHVRKPNGAKPGFVTYDSQKTLTVNPEKSIIDKLKK